MMLPAVVSMFFFPPEDIININIEELTPVVNFLVPRFPDTHEHCMYVEVVKQAKSEGDAVRA